MSAAGCPRMSHHWISNEDCLFDVDPTHVCKHCGQFGMKCELCYGEGCERCRQEGVNPCDNSLVVVWTESDVTTHDPDHETLRKAFLRLFGRELDTSTAIRRRDEGDGILFTFPDGVEVFTSFPGNSQIWKRKGM